MRPRRCLRAARPNLRVGRLRYPATVCPDGWSPPHRVSGAGQNPAYRPARPPRLVDQEICSCCGFALRRYYARRCAIGAAKRTRPYAQRLKSSTTSEYATGVLRQLLRQIGLGTIWGRVLGGHGVSSSLVVKLAVGCAWRCIPNGGTQNVAAYFSIGLSQVVELR